jgi:hypothetical protein
VGKIDTIGMGVDHLFVKPMGDEHLVKLSCKRLPSMRLVVTDKDE